MGERGCPVEIRRCVREDAAAVGAFYDEVVKELCDHVNYPKWMYKKYPAESSAREMIEAGCQFACVRDGEVVGAFVLNEDPQGAYENVAWGCSLERGEYLACHAVASSARLRRAGIGRQIVEYCKAYAKEHGYRAIRLDVVPENFPARNLYETCGFRYVGDADLERGIEGIPLFSMYEMNL